MATWIEIRCSESRDSGEYGIENRCWSDVNSGPMQMALDTRESLIKTMRALEKDAKITGWRKKAKGWICPYCIAQIENE